MNFPEEATREEVEVSVNDVASVGGGSTTSKSTLGMYSSTRTAATRSSRKSSKSKRKKMINWPTLIRETFTNLFDLIGDWVYLWAIYTRHYVDVDNDADEAENNLLLDFEKVMLILLFFCFLSTVLGLWTIQTTTLAACGKKSMCCNCTVPRLSLLGIVLEDIPQFVLTCYIDYNLIGSLSPAGVLNICSSLSSLVVRLTSRYEEVQDENDDKLQPIIEFAM
ncbi:hypothetical protein ACHAWT_006870 [Skeletonema menzelii]